MAGVWRSIMRFALASLTLASVAACGGSGTPEVSTPMCDRLLELGQLDRYAERSITPAGSLEATVERFLASDMMKAGGLLTENKNIIGECEVRLAHAKNLPQTTPSAATEIIRMVLIEPETPDQHQTLVAAGERFYCGRSPTPAWQTSPCNEGD